MPKTLMIAMFLIFMSLIRCVLFGTYNVLFKKGERSVPGVLHCEIWGRVRVMLAAKRRERRLGKNVQALPCFRPSAFSLT